MHLNDLRLVQLISELRQIILYEELAIRVIAGTF